MNLRFDEQSQGVVASVSLKSDRPPSSLEAMVDEHRINPKFLANLGDALANVETSKSLRGFIFSSEGRFFCNGFDTKFVRSGLDVSEVKRLQYDFQVILLRILKLPCPTVCILNGHCVGAGALLSMAFDYRFVSPTADPGSLFFIPAIDLGLVYTSLMTKLVSLKAGPNVARDLLLYSRRYNLQGCPVVDGKWKGVDAFPWKKNGSCLVTVRSRLYTNELAGHLDENETMGLENWVKVDEFSKLYQLCGAYSIIMIRLTDGTNINACII